MGVAAAGFNYCYDKRLYDRILHGPAEQCVFICWPTIDISTASYGSWRTMTSRGLCLPARSRVVP